MHKLAGLLVVSLSVLAGCAGRQQLFPASPLSVFTPQQGDSRCVERLLARSRTTGYIEQTVDKDMGFFRVSAKNVLATSNASKKKAPKIPKGKRRAVVAFYNVQCTGPDSATTTPMNQMGSLDANDLMGEWQLTELEDYAGALGVPPPPPVQ